ncbi:MAG TPA: hypothetical protein VLF17_07545, partial [Candidatus Nitrosotenuis sp.]|nr:hypothetical protein [Candidatus Nitrosotenuis sp.]
EKTKMELQQKEEMLKHLQEEIEEKNKKKLSAPEDPLSVIREELAKLGISGESDRLASALNALSGMVNKDQTQPQNAS